MNSASCHCIALRRVNKAVTEYYDGKLKPCGVTINQFSLMRNLERLDSPSVSGLADAMGLERSTLVRTLQPLFAAGLIEDRSAAGTRNRSLALTKKGKGTLAAGEALWREAQRGFEERLGAKNLAAWRSMLDVLAVM